MSDYISHKDLVDPYGDWEREERVVAECEYCGEDIYDDEEYYEVEMFEYVHRDCFADYMADKYEDKLHRPD